MFPVLNLFIKEHRIQDKSKINMNKSVKERIYNYCCELYKMAPWEYMLETDVFGVKLPGRNKNYYISIMGSAGKMKAISAYEGDIALQMFWEIQKKDSGLQPWAILDIPHTMLSFPDRHLAMSEKMNIFLPDGINANGEFVPVIDKVVPGLVYFPPTETDLEDLLIILEQSVKVLNRASENNFFLMPEGYDEYLIRESKPAATGLKWGDFYRKINSRNILYSRKYSEEMLFNLIKIRKTGNIFQLDLIMLPRPVMDKGPRGYFAYALLLTDSETGDIEGCKLLTPFPDLHSMHESVPEHVLELLNKLPVVPRQIKVRTGLMDALLTSLLEKAGVEVKKVRKLDGIDRALNNLMSHITCRA